MSSFDPQEKLLTKKKVSKMRPYWNYSPDKTEQWLEKMESKGFNLCKMIGSYNFLFVKGKPRKVKYGLDYQEFFTQEYLEKNEESGWKFIDKTWSNWNAICLWSKEFDDKPPIFFGDIKKMRKRAINAFMLYYILYIITATFIVFSTYELYTISTKIYLLFISFHCSIIAIKSFLYYLRHKRKTKGDR